MSWWGRLARQWRPTLSSPEAPPSPDERATRLPDGHAGSCGRWGCDAELVWNCAYVDRFGRRCETWCEKHLVVRHGRAWCERHVNVIDRLVANNGTIYAADVLPDVDDRMPQLVWMTVEDMEPEVRRVLLAAAPEGSRSSVATDPELRSVVVRREKLTSDGETSLVQDAGSERRWQRGWGLFSERGYLHRVSVRSGRKEPPELELLVDNRSVWLGVPTWIAMRTGEAGRAAFTAMLVQMVAEAIAGRGQRWTAYDSPTPLVRAER